MELFHEDALYRDPARPGGVRGREDIGAYLEIFLARVSGWEFSVVDFWQAEGERIMLKWRVKMSIGARIVDEVGVMLLQLRDGLVWDCELYYDRSGWFEQLRGA